MRALLLVLDGVGCGETPDAAAFGDAGANTLGHIFEALPELELPALFSLGLWKSATGDVFSPRALETHARWGRMRPASPGKDSMAGHWELAGAVLSEPFAVHAEFPTELVEKLSAATGVKFLGNYARNGEAIFQELGAEHLRTGAPILYTAGDSVMQIAAHERVMPLARLHDICRKARRICDVWRIGRVIARPFAGDPGAFEPTRGRHDYPMVPPRTVLNAIAETGLPVNGIGRVGSLFAGSGITQTIAAQTNGEAMAAIDQLWQGADDGFIFANLGEFDSPHGHARDLHGFAERLVEFDEWLGGFLGAVEEDDLVIITADHGNDPTFRGNGRTREEVPLLVCHEGRRGPLGTRRSFADVAATLAQYFRVRGGWGVGRAF